MTEKMLYKIFDIAAFMGMICAFVARMQRIDPKVQTPSVFLNANYYGTIITFTFLICLYRLITESKNEVFLIASMLVELYGLASASCWTAIFCIALGTLIILFYLKKRKIAFALMVAGVIFSALFMLTPAYEKIFALAVRNISIRWGIWETGIKAFLRQPFFGVGMMGYYRVYKLYGSQANYHCHNLFIDALLSFGIIGVTPAVAYAVRTVKNAVKSKMLPLFSALFAAVMLHSLFDLTIVWIQTGAFAVILMTMTKFKKD